jgi:hypothetical protein
VSLQRVTDLLELTAVSDVEVRTHKQNPEPLAELVVNYAELKRRFVGTEWSTFVEE